MSGRTLADRILELDWRTPVSASEISERLLEVFSQLDEASQASIRLSGSRAKSVVTPLKINEGSGGYKRTRHMFAHWTETRYTGPDCGNSPV